MTPMSLEEALEVAIRGLGSHTLELDTMREAAATLREFLSAGGPAYMHERGWHPEHRTETVARLKALEEEMRGIQFVGQPRETSFGKVMVMPQLSKWTKEIAAIRKALGADD